MQLPPAASTALRLTGGDVLAVLHRVTTQKLVDLAPGEARTTLFCDSRGRLLHRATVVRAPDGIGLAAARRCTGTPSLPRAWNARYSART